MPSWRSRGMSRWSYARPPIRNRWTLSATACRLLPSRRERRLVSCDMRCVRQAGKTRMYGGEDDRALVIALGVRSESFTLQDDADKYRASSMTAHKQAQ